MVKLNKDNAYPRTKVRPATQADAYAVSQGVNFHPDKPFTTDTVLTVVAVVLSGRDVRGFEMSGVIVHDPADNRFSLPYIWDFERFVIHEEKS